MTTVRSRYEEIAGEVHELLSTIEGRAKIEARREHARKMADGLRRWTEDLKRGRMRYRGAVFTVRQGALEGAIGRRASLVVNVEINGVGVGQIEFSSASPPMFSSNTDLATQLAWSGSARDGAKINAYLEQCRASKSMPERDVQGHMSARFRALFGDAQKPVGGLVPVRPAGCMMEIPTAVAASSKLQIGGGAIDILARTGRGRTGWFVACELKRYDSAEPAADVLRQAIRYATALDIEVNGCGLLPPADSACYRELFGGSGSAPLRFGALAAISALRREEVTDALAELEAPKATWLGALLYTQDKTEVRATLVRP